ncbi:MAG TPA: class I SAM-dependent methyltransferase [Nevskiaceae bacterium]
MWPDRDDRPELDILIAGCGTNQAAVFARGNPGARVVAIDVSQSSLDHERYLKDRHGLDNLELRLLPIEEAPKLGRRFDLIVSTGVLHHLCDPAAGLKALGACLKPDGVAALMLYARYGRIGVELLQSLFADMGLGQDERSVQIVRETLASLPAAHPVRGYLQITTDLTSDAALVDTFLHGRARSYTVSDCLELVAHAGLAFQDWLFHAPYYPHDRAHGLGAAVATLSPAQQWAAMERINTVNACHFFIVRRPDSPLPVIDFGSDGALDYVPHWRMRCGLEGGRMVRPGWSFTPSAEQAALAGAIDGKRTIREIAGSGDPGAATAVFRALWELDFIAPEVSSAGTPR